MKKTVLIVLALAALCAPVQAQILPGPLVPYNANLLRNPSFAINQHSVSGTVSLTAGQYGHDGVKGGAAGATYTFATTGIDTTITVSAGSIILPIEAGLVAGGSYTFSQDGTATARLWQGTGSTGSGSYVAGPQTATWTANTQSNVEFSTGTVLRPRLVPGTAQASVFNRLNTSAEWAFDQRYLVCYGGTSLYEKANATVSMVTTTQALVTFPLPVPMASSPSLTINVLTISVAGVLENLSAQAVDATSLVAPTFTFTVSTGTTAGFTGVLQAQNSLAAYACLSAELN